MNPTKELLDRLRDMAGKAQFISLTYRSKKANELARHTLIFGSSYDKQVQASLDALLVLQAVLTEPLQKIAAQELIDSFKASLESHAKGEYNPDYTKPDLYVHISEGLKYNTSTGVINVSGLAHAKVVLEAGVYKPVKSRPLTIAKDELRDKLPIGRWKEFCITSECLQTARLQGVELALN